MLGAENATALLAGPDAPFSHLDLEAVLRELEESRKAIPRLEQRIRDLETEIGAPHESTRSWSGTVDLFPRFWTAASLPAPLSPAPPPLSAVANGFALSSSFEANTPTSFVSYDGRNGSPGPGAFLSPSHQAVSSDTHRMIRRRHLPKRTRHRHLASGPTGSPRRCGSHGTGADNGRAGRPR